MTPGWAGLRDDLAALHAAALAAADPAAAVARTLRAEAGRLTAGDQAIPLEASSRVWLVAIGKASPGMARAALAALGPRLAGGIVAHPRAADPGGDWPAAVGRFPAGHPLPDEGSLRAGAAALEMVQGAGPQDVVLVLVSGGGSALFESLLPGVTLDEFRSLTEALLRSGADIVELNTIRRSLSRVKAGGLARAAGAASVLSLVLSDVVGDRLESIASGPTVGEPPAPGEAAAILERRGLAGRFPAVLASLRAGRAAAAGGAGSGDRRVLLIGSNRMAAEALCAEARSRGFATLLLSDRLQGEAREAGRLVGAIARGMAESGLPFPAPACVVLGGETTVTVRGEGRGGRNLELALGAALALDGCRHAAVFSFATDGVDGKSSAAGAVAHGETLARARALGRTAHAALADNDAEPFFEALGDLWVTGPSGTNVNDLAVALAYP